MKADAEVDCIGVFCPMPISMTKEGIEDIKVEEILKVEADDPAAEDVVELHTWPGSLLEQAVILPRVHRLAPPAYAAYRLPSLATPTSSFVGTKKSMKASTRSVVRVESRAPAFLG